VRTYLWLTGLAVLLSGFAAGCGGYSWQRELRHQASYQHDCPESEIQIISDDGNRLGRRARVAVCGRTRVYEQVNAGASYEWRDMTAGDDDAQATNPPG